MTGQREGRGGEGEGGEQGVEARVPAGGSHVGSVRMKGEGTAAAAAALKERAAAPPPRPRPPWSASDKGRLARRVPSARGSQALGQGRCMNKSAYKHLIITQPEEAL